MNIQSYILPKWKEEIKDQELAEDIENDFIISGASMAEYLDRFMMRSLPDNWFKGWTRYKFPLKTDQLVLEIHEIIGENFGEYIEKYRNGNKTKFQLSAESISSYIQLQEQYQQKIREIEENLQALRDEVKQNRAQLEKPERKERRKKEKKKKKLEKDIPEDISENVKAEASDSIPDHDYVYDKWMEMVESKPISKSYWHIHEYLSRYILTFVEENSEDGKVTKELIEGFLEEYGKGKRPKTMNHYTRVIYRFLEFYENLLEDENPMEVW